MKDLYYMLNIDQDASTEEIAAALELNPELGACSSILLDERKRAEYDRTHTALKTIGLLRHRLGLNSISPWFQDSYPDFASRLRPAASVDVSAEAKAVRSPLAEAPPLQQYQGMKSEIRDPSNWLVPVLVGIIIVSLLVLLYTFL